VSDDNKKTKLPSKANRAVRDGREELGDFKTTLRRRRDISCQEDEWKPRRRGQPQVEKELVAPYPAAPMKCTNEGVKLRDNASYLRVESC
jgi:hypothetical protein